MLQVCLTTAVSKETFGLVISYTEDEHISIYFNKHIQTYG